jgi:hypothetical protein
MMKPQNTARVAEAILVLLMAVNCAVAIVGLIVAHGGP